MNTLTRRNPTQELSIMQLVRDSANPFWTHVYEHVSEAEITAAFLANGAGCEICGAELAPGFVLAEGQWRRCVCNQS